MTAVLTAARWRYFGPRPDGGLPCGKTLARSAGARLRFGRRGGRGHRKASLAHQRGDARVASAELPVRVGRIDGVARGKDVVVEPLGHRLVVRSALLDECLPGVR